MARPNQSIGDVQKVMGTDARLLNTQRINGVVYELYIGVDDNGRKSDKGFVRIYDLETGNTVSIAEHPTFGQAQSVYFELIQSDANHQEK